MPFQGYWESAEPTAEGMKIVAWAFDEDMGSAPVRFVLTWAGQTLEWAPNSKRADVTAQVGEVRGIPGLDVLAPVNLDPHADWSDASLSAVWRDGTTHQLSPLRGSSAEFVNHLGFRTFDVFEARFQNPAFRMGSPLLQAYGAARALRVAGDDVDFWLAGAVLGIYRCILDGTFKVEWARGIVNKWKGMQDPLRVTATGKRLRWASSMHLAAGYAYLAWGEPEAARKEFAAMSDYMPRLVTWPQSLTNLGIGRLLAVWLTAKLSGRAAALPLLDGTEDAFQAGMAPLKIWNWHMYEEARNALGVWQKCFVMKMALEGGQEDHVLPKMASFRLSDVSAVTRLLIAMGLVADETLPGPPRA
jgi:hypothetical protein